MAVAKGWGDMYLLVQWSVWFLCVQVLGHHGWDKVLNLPCEHWEKGHLMSVRHET